MSIFNKEGALKDLKIIKEVFEKQGVKFFLAYGTCLGAVRDKDFIEWDDDIDLGVIEPLTLKKKKEIGWMLYDLGFNPQQLTFNVFGRMELVEPGYNGTEKTGIMVIEKNVHITIFFFHKEKEEYLCAPRIGAKVLIGSPTKFYDKLETIKFKGDNYLTPSPVKDYLEFTYTNWEKPNKTEHGKLYNE